MSVEFTISLFVYFASILIYWILRQREELVEFFAILAAFVYTPLILLFLVFEERVKWGYVRRYFKKNPDKYAVEWMGTTIHRIKK